MDSPGRHITPSRKRCTAISSLGIAPAYSALCFVLRSCSTMRPLLRIDPRDDDGPPDMQSPGPRDAKNSGRPPRPFGGRPAGRRGTSSSPCAASTRLTHRGPLRRRDHRRHGPAHGVRPKTAGAALRLDLYRMRCRVGHRRTQSYARNHHVARRHARGLSGVRALTSLGADVTVCHRGKTATTTPTPPARPWPSTRRRSTMRMRRIMGWCSIMSETKGVGRDTCLYARRRAARAGLGPRREAAAFSQFRARGQADRTGFE